MNALAQRSQRPYAPKEREGWLIRVRGTRLVIMKWVPVAGLLHQQLDLCGALDLGQFRGISADGHTGTESDGARQKSESAAGCRHVFL